VQKQSTEQLVTFPLASIVSDLLRKNEGQDPQHFVTVCEITAECLYTVCKNEHTCHVQMPSDDDVDILGKPITSPVLWEIGAWLNSSERWQRQKLMSQKRIDIHNIYNANINRISRCILRMSPINPDAARMLAHRWMERGDMVRIQMVGVNKLFEKVEEI